MTRRTRALDVLAEDIRDHIEHEIGTFLVGIAPTDAAAFAIPTGVLLVAAAVACYLPSRRAAAVDPCGAATGMNAPHPRETRRPAPAR